MFDSVNIIDTSGIEHIALVELRNGMPFSSIPVAELPAWFSQDLPQITKAIANTML